MKSITEIHSDNIKVGITGISRLGMGMSSLTLLKQAMEQHEQVIVSDPKEEIDPDALMRCIELI